MGLGTYIWGSNRACEPGCPGSPSSQILYSGKHNYTPPLLCGLLIQSQAAQGELRDSTGRACRLYLDLELRRLREDRPQLQSQPDSRLLFPMLPRSPVLHFQKLPSGPYPHPTYKGLGHAISLVSPPTAESWELSCATEGWGAGVVF